MCTLLDSERRKSQFIHNGKRGIPLQETSVAKWEKEKPCLELPTYPANEKVGGEIREKKRQIFVKMKNLPPFLSL